MKGKRLKYDVNPLRIPRGGPVPEIECPLLGGDYVSFEDCLACDQFDDDENSTSHCLIKEEERREGIRKQEEEFSRRAAEWDVLREKEDRKMRKELAAINEEIEKNSEKWQQEYEKQEEENKKRVQEWDEMTRQSLVDVHGREMTDWLEQMDEKEKELEDEEVEEDEEEEEEDDADDDDEENW
jgi:hypothetical protein